MAGGHHEHDGMRARAPTRLRRIDIIHRSPDRGTVLYATAITPHTSRRRGRTRVWAPLLITLLLVSGPRSACWLARDVRPGRQKARQNRALWLNMWCVWVDRRSRPVRRENENENSYSLLACKMILYYTPEGEFFKHIKSNMAKTVRRQNEHRRACL